MSSIRWSSRFPTLFGACLLVALSTNCQGCRHPQNPDGGGAGDCTGTICAVTGIPSAAALDFGNDPLGNPVQLKLTLHNTGTAVLNVMGASITGPNASDFKLGVKLGPQIQQDGSASTMVTFVPSTAGALSATVAIETDGSPGTLDVPLTGFGMDIEICAHPTFIDFGNVQVQGTPSTKTITIGNCGLSPVSISFPGINGPQATDFSATGESNTTLQPAADGGQGDTLDITVSYSPAAAGPSTAGLPYVVCSGIGCTQTINLTGVGVDGQLTFSPTPVNFGAPPPPPPAPTAQVIGTNTGTEPLTVTNLGTYNNNNVFTISGAPTLPLVLNPLQNFSITITYNTTGSPGGDQDQLLGVFTVADPLVPHRTAQDLLSGNQSLGPCTLAISPTSVNFGLVSANQTGTRVVTVTDTGGTPCQVSGLALSASTDPYFALAPGQPAAFTVQPGPGSAQQITITFSPTSQATPLLRTGQLLFQTGDSANPNASVPLSANIQGPSVYADGWPKWHLDNFNSGQSSADTSGLQGVVAWKYNIGSPNGGLASLFGGGTYINSPVISTVTGLTPAPPYAIYQMDINGVLHALAGGIGYAAAGTQVWQQSLSSPSGDTHPSTPAVLSDGSMFVASGSDGNPPNLYYISNIGAVTFSEPYGEDGFDSCPALGQDGTLFLADDDGASSSCGGAGSNGSDPDSAIAFTANAGSVTQIGGLALPLTAESERFGTVVAADDTSYWGNNGQFFAISPPKAGFGLVPAWPSCGVTLANQNLSAVSDLALDGVTNNNLYAYSAWVGGSGNSVQGNLAALDPGTGAQKWLFNLPAGNVSNAIAGLPSAAGNAAPAVALDGTVYVGNGDGLHSINGATGTENPNWPFSSADVTSSPAIGADGTVFFGCGDGNFYAVNPDGTLRFKITTGGPISSSPAIAPDGTVVFVSDDGNLYAIN